MRTEKMIIDLNRFKTKGSKVFTGRDRGIKIRTESNINKTIENEQDVLIKIPEDIMSINPSFLEEFLFNLVTHYGATISKQKIQFTSLNPRYDVTNDFEEAIDRILRRNNSLMK